MPIKKKSFAFSIVFQFFSFHNLSKKYTTRLLSISLCVFFPQRSHANLSLPNQIREDLYGSNLRASLEGLDFSRLDDLAASKLEELFTEKEVHAALLNLKGDKAPGPDGFTATFWHCSWDFVKMDIMDLFKDFHERGKFGKV